MKKISVNPLFKTNDIITFDEIDVTESKLVSVYKASGISELEKGEKIFEFYYESLFDDETYNKLSIEFDDTELFENLYRLMCFTYFSIYSDCQKWFVSNNIIKGGFDIKLQIELYKQRISNDFTCPILRHLNNSSINNTNFYQNIGNAMRYAYSNDIKTVHKLLYGEDGFKDVKAEPTSIGGKLINSVTNIAYNRFKVFLESNISGEEESNISGEEGQKKLEFKFKNNFDNIEVSKIYNHFKAGLVDKRYLTEQELNEYLKAAFELKTKPETLFKIKDAPNKQAIEAVFYIYYKNVAGKVHGKQNQYAALLGEYFEGYKTNTIITNFSKSVY